MNFTQEQIDSLVRTALKMLSAVLIAHGAQQAATQLNTPDVVEASIGVVTAFISIMASHKTHAPDAPTVTNPPTEPPKQ